jgi:hypothetical protein
MLEDLRILIREMIEDELYEFSGVGTVAGPILPLGMSSTPLKKKKKKNRQKTTLGESLSGVPVGDTEFSFQNWLRYPENDDDYPEYEHLAFYDSISMASKAFCNAENPFGSNRSAGIKKSLRYLKGQLKYPHST